MSDNDEEVSFLDREYDARGRTQSFDRERIYRERSQAAFGRTERIADLVYDTESGSKLDIYPSGRGAPLFVWFHGGYWRSSTKDANAFVAPGLVDAGVTVASVDYSLAPAVRIGEIVRQVRTSVAWLAQNAHKFGYENRRIHVGGHSAGGHLVGMLLAERWQESFGLSPSAIRTGLAISGLFDLVPLQKTFVNEDLKLDESEIRDNSPINIVPKTCDATLLATVGGLESSEFHRQTDDYLRAWQRAGHRGTRIDMPDFHHFDIILRLEGPGNALFDNLLASIQKNC
jgi:arylformamidase